MPTTTTNKPASAVNTVNDQEFIDKIYDSNLESQKQTITDNYNKNVSNLEAAQKKSQQQTDANLNKTFVDAYRGRKNYSEVQGAYGLSSGAMAQARLAQNNQLQSDMTAIRNTQAQADAEAERQKALLSQGYSSEIAKAQADNDFARAQALYEAAKRDEETLLGLQKEAGSLIADKIGDYSILGAIYGLTPEQIAKLQGGGYQEPVLRTGAPPPEETVTPSGAGQNKSIFY